MLFAATGFGTKYSKDCSRAAKAALVSDVIDFFGVFFMGSAIHLFVLPDGVLTQLDLRQYIQFGNAAMQHDQVSR